ncbi:MAG: DNA polymerase III subunit gamma/tau [Lachnospiraceae bacterium]|nr:DNA polymerase III subunit gamma/tau [Lachnospiraceae bacterium]
MSYVALYRKFRPNDFGEVKGQDEIVTTLKNQLKLGRLGHAYLFTGTRGTGKTTIAKIMAKAVNCEHPTENGPCNECAMCRAIQAQNAVNVMEIDAASNNSVDNAREIIESVQYSPADGKYKVYIIDEAHMLSQAAFNALLKTIEEPPEYVLFIFATTEVHKIPVTILSRCQRYDFQRLTIDDIAGQLGHIIEEEHTEAEDRALRYIAKAADGSMRDAISLLDRCVSFCIGGKLTYDKVLDVLGAIDTSVFFDMLSAVVKGDIKNVLGIIDAVINEGREIAWFVNEFIWYLRNLLIISAVDDGQQMDKMEEMMDMSADNLELLKSRAGEIDSDSIIRYIRILSELASAVRYSGQKRVLTEVAFIKLCRPQMETDVTSLKDRIHALEIQVEMIGSIPAAAIDAKCADSAGVEAEVKKPQKIVLPSALGEDVKIIVKNWDEILEGISPATRAVLRSFHLSVPEGDNKSMLLVTDSEAMYNIILKSFEEIQNAVNGYVNKEVTISVKHISESDERSGAYPDIAKLLKNGVVVEY